MIRTLSTGALVAAITLSGGVATTVFAKRLLNG